MPSCTCHTLCAAKKEISNLYRVKFDCVVKESCNAEFVECLPKECITADRGKEVKSFLEYCVVKFLSLIHI